MYIIAHMINLSIENLNRRAEERVTKQRSSKKILRSKFRLRESLVKIYANGLGEALIIIDKRNIPINELSQKHDREFIMRILSFLTRLPRNRR